MKQGTRIRNAKLENEIKYKPVVMQAYICNMHAGW